MGSHFVNVDRDTPLLLPPDMRDWVPEDDMVHFVIQAVGGMKLEGLKFNRRGTGSDQYPPRMMLSLLIYCYSMGVFSSRRIERATYRDVGVRFLTGDTHPDHDTICTFRRENLDLVGEVFLEVLKLAGQMGLLKVGTVSVDGTHIPANASKNKNIGYERAGELEAQLKLDIADLLAKASKADDQGSDEGQRLPEGIARREALLAKMEAARKQLQERANAREQAQRVEYQKKLADRQERKDNDDPPRGAGPREPKAKPEKQGTTNLTDPDSRVMLKNTGGEYKQAYNMQAAADAEGSMLLLAVDAVQCPNDTGQLQRMVEKVPAEIGRVTRVLADTGYMDAGMIQEMEAQGLDMYVAVGKSTNHDRRRYDYRPREVLEKAHRPEKPLNDPRLLKMCDKLHTPEGKKMYALRKQSVEPVFGIIKSAMGFTRCLMRGLDKVRGEFTLVAVAYNFKRLWSLKLAR